MSEVTLEKEEIERIIFGFAVQAQKKMTSELEMPKQRVIVLSGPTCAGKSRLAMDLAKELGGEIVTADSMQVYRDLDIGTAKPTLNDQKEIPHHLIDIRDVDEEFNVVDFYYEARQACQSILARDRVPIVVGGSGFYIHALLYGPPSGPPSLPEVRKSIEKEFDELGADKMFQRLRAMDPQYASSITKHDRQKIVRALEIMTLGGKKVSQLSWKGRRKPKNFDFRCWFLYRPKDKLYERIEQRCEVMLEEGLLDEVKKLKESGIEKNTSLSQAIGYRQALQYFETPQTDQNYEAFVEAFKRASRKYAKRQFTWFRKEPLFRWLDLDMHDPEVAIDMIRQDYQHGI